MADLVVIGAGIVGASVAYHAARRGAAVTLVDNGLPASGVTGDSFAWIGASGVGTGAASSALRSSATEDYRRLEAELPDLNVTWAGSLSWGDAWPTPGQAELGSGQRLVDAAAVAELEPELSRPPAYAVHAPGDGAVDPVAVTETLVDGAREHGAEVLLGAAVFAIQRERGRIGGVATSAGVLRACTVVVAAGIGTPVLCAHLGVDVPVAPSPALLLRFAARKGLVHSVVSSPIVEVRQRLDGELLAAADYRGHWTGGDVERTARRVLAGIVSTFHDSDTVELRSVQVGVRPMPRDGEPIIGSVPDVPGLYLTVMHSGVTLGPAVGRLVAHELLDDKTADQLHGCRPARFLASG